MSFACVEMLQSALWRRLEASPADWPAVFAIATTVMTLALGAALWRFVELPFSKRFAPILSQVGEGRDIAAGAHKSLMGER